MKRNPAIEIIVHALVVALSLVALWLVLNAPASFLNARVVYQGF
ncbi:MAG TPA: hypothetical protein VF492_11430 [Verrucomicrobiae bacterium]